MEPAVPANGPVLGPRIPHFETPFTVDPLQAEQVYGVVRISPRVTRDSFACEAIEVPADANTSLNDEAL